jgi:hypothetical protein
LDDLPGLGENRRARIGALIEHSAPEP